MTRTEIGIRVRFLLSFRDLFDARERALRLPRGSDLRRLIGVLCSTPGQKQALLACDNLRAHVVVLRNGVPVQSMKGLDTELADGDTITLSPFLAGG